MRPSRIVLGAALLAPLVVASPSHAQTACLTGTSINALEALGSTGCIIGDKIYSDFSFTGAWNKTSNDYTFTNMPVDQHTFSGSGLALMTGVYSYTYKVSIAPGNPLQRIYAYATGSGSSDPINPLSATKDLTGTGGGTVVSLNGANSSSYFYSPTITGPVTFSSSITVASGRLDIITDSLVQQPVPGPLPLLGAGAAFGFSRKLRNRIKQAG